MPYYDTRGKVEGKTRTMVKRPPPVYETMSPGPQYAVPSSIAPRRRTIGARTVEKDPHLENPGPGSYWLAPEAPAPPPVMGIIGPLQEERALINTRGMAEMPGPGKYADAVDYFAPGKYKGFTLKHRPSTDVRPDTAPPYHACRSTLGGPKFTIGLRGV
jgi:hypothetical protein